MNILFLSPSYFPIRGGTEQVIYSLVSHLKPSHTIKILTIRWEKKWKRFEIIDNIEIYRVGFLNIKGLSLYFKYLSLFFAALKLKKSFKFNIIHLFHVYDCGGAAYLLKKIQKIPLITTLIGWDTYDPIRKIPKRHMPFVRITMNVSDIVTASTRHLVSAAKKQGCKKEIKIITYGTGMHSKVSLKHINIKQKYNIINKKALLSVQRLHPRKGIQYLLRAIPEVIKTNSTIAFIIVGTGPEEGNLKRLTEKLGINNYVIFTGFISDDELPSYYASADLFILPTLYEGFGLVYIDALCFGLPIVTTENGGSLDIVNKDNGILVPPKDPIKLGETIIEALNKKWDSDKIKRGAEKYRWEGIVEEYNRLYKKLTTS